MEPSCPSNSPIPTAVSPRCSFHSNGDSTRSSTCDLGQALAPLREEGVLLIGSGSSFHNMRAFGTAAALSASKEFDDWLAAILSLPQLERDAQLTEWTQAPQGRFCHPREEHLVPLHVIAGTATQHEEVSFPFRALVLGTHMLAAEFSEPVS